MTAWLDENCGADGWAMTPSETRGVLNDAVLPRRYRRERLCCAVVCRLQGRDGGGRFQGAGRRAGGENRCEHALDAVTQRSGRLILAAYERTVLAVDIIGAGWASSTTKFLG